MNKKITGLLKKLGLLDEEVERCFTICPGLEFLDIVKAKDCLIALVKMGYPKEDLGLLIAANPSVLLFNPTDLEVKLKSLGDVSETLKADPFII
ncbi:MAG: hypothetical protein J5689_01505 [Clostridia bacterium]|nr:hypothetical protein [Clostridia bacterium]